MKFIARRDRLWSGLAGRSIGGGSGEPEESGDEPGDGIDAHDERRGATIIAAHSTALRADAWPDDLRLSDVEEKFVCSARGKHGADVRPDFSWNKMRVKTMGYR